VRAMAEATVRCPPGSPSVLALAVAESAGCARLPSVDRRAGCARLSLSGPPTRLANPVRDRQRSRVGVRRAHPHQRASESASQDLGQGLVGRQHTSGHLTGAHPRSGSRRLLRCGALDAVHLAPGGLHPPLDVAHDRGLPRPGPHDLAHQSRSQGGDQLWEGPRVLAILGSALVVGRGRLGEPPGRGPSGGTSSSGRQLLVGRLRMAPLSPASTAPSAARSITKAARGESVSTGRPAGARPLTRPALLSTCGTSAMQTGRLGDSLASLK
jgi:hypothetical protein